MGTVRVQASERQLEGARPHRPGGAAAGGASADMLLRLQRTAGNAATTAMLQRDPDLRALLQNAGNRGPYATPSESKLSGHADRAGMAENVGGGVADGGAAGLLTAEPTKNTKDTDAASAEGAAGLWMAAGAGDVVAGPAAFIGGLNTFRDQHSSLEDRVNAVFGMTSAVTQTVGGGATVINSAYGAAGQAEDAKLKKAGSAAKSTQTKIAGGVGWNAPAFVQDFVSGLKGSIETILKFKDVHASRKSKDDSKATTAGIFVDATASFLSSIKSVVSGAKYVLKFLESGAADAVASYAVPGVGLAVNAAHLIVKIFHAVKAAGKRAAMKFTRGQLLDKVLKEDSTLGRVRKDKKAKRSEEEGHTWRDRLRAAAAAGGPAAAWIKEYLLADLMQRIAKKRFVRAVTTMVPKVAGILGDILTLTGIGAIGGTVAKAFGSAWDVGQTAFRWAKQKVHDRKPEHHKSTASKQREYVAASDAIFDKYVALTPLLTPGADRSEFALWKAEAEAYVKAAGARPRELYGAKDMPEAYRLLIKAMKDR